VRTKGKKPKTPSFPPSELFQLLPPCSAGEQGDWTGGCGQSVALHLHHSFSVPLCPCSTWAPLHGLQLRPGACSCGGSPWAAASSRPHPPAPPGAPPPMGGLQRGDLLHGGPMGCRGTACSTRGLSLHSPQGNCCCLPAAPPALLRRSPGGLQGCFSHAFTILSLSAAVAQQYFPPFLKSAPPKPTQQHSLPRLWPAAAPFWSHLELALL